MTKNRRQTIKKPLLSNTGSSRKDKPPEYLGHEPAKYPRSAQFAGWLGLAILLIAPLHGLLTVWLSQTGLSYTLLRGWNAVALVIFAGFFMYWLLRDAALRRWLLGSFLIRAILFFTIILLVIGGRGVLFGDVSWQAFGLSLFQHLRYLAFFVMMMVLMRYSRREATWFVRAVLVSGLVAALLAVLQYTVLPSDFMKHFGYGPNTIDVAMTINNNPDFPRVSGTLRGPNPLGAFMVVVLGLLAAIRPKGRQWLWYSSLAVFSVLALLFSFSRSAWLGAAVVAVLLLFWQLRQTKHKKIAAVSVVAAAALLLVGFLVFRSNQAVQNAVFHTDDETSISVSSNDQRVDAVKDATSDLISDPLGTGVGSAGPASVHNERGEPQFAENYYLQIGQETGYFGMIAYLLLTAAVAFELWQARRSRLALALLAVFAGLFVVNLLSHAWTDDTLALVWWGLAGVATGSHIWRDRSADRAKLKT